MKHRVADLDGALLDAAVAKAEGMTEGDRWQHRSGAGFYPSREWQDGGPILERERISLDAGDAVTEWSAYCPMDPKLGIASQDGPTPLVAAMRAYVSATFGEEVELP